LTTALVDVAAVQGDGSRWRDYGWEVLFLDGKQASASEFMTAEERARFATDWDRERTALELEQSGEHLAAVLVNGSLPEDLNEAIRSASEARTADSRSRIVLYDRVLEMVASHAGIPHGRELVDLLANMWPVASINADFVGTINAVLSEERFSGVPEGERLAETLRTNRPGGRFEINVIAVSDHADRLVELCRETLLEDRVQATLATLSTPDAYLEALVQSQTRVGRLCTRLRRVRNALAHGNPVHPAVIESVEDFARFLGHSALRLALEALAAGTTVQALIAAHDQEHQEVVEALRADHPYIEIVRRGGADSGGEPPQPANGDVR
jgi:hypothetical protein